MHRCVYACVSKELLDLLDGHTFVNRVRCQRAAKLMWMYAMDAACPAKLPKTRLDASYAESPGVCVQRDEEGGGVIIPRFKIRLQMELCARVKIDWSLFVSLACHNALSFLQVDIRDIKTYKLSDAHSCGSEHINDRQISDCRAMIA